LLDSDTYFIKQNGDLIARKENYLNIISLKDLEKSYELDRLSGWFSISAFPYAEVEIDGKPVGKLGERVPPVKKVQVTPGKHKIKFILKDYAEEDISAEIEESAVAGETKRVHHKFENIPKKETEKTSETKSQIKEGGKGWLIIKAFPYAKIEIDGKSYREVPPALEVKLDAGKHIIKFIASRLNKTHVMEVNLIKDERKEIMHRFD
jgi:hypothetical protein